MRFPQLHKFLIWAGSALFGGVGTAILAFAGLASIYPKVKEWGANWFLWAWPIMMDLWFWVFLALSIIAYLAALAWTGNRSPAQEAQLAYEVEAAKQRAIDEAASARGKRESQNTSMAAMGGSLQGFMLEHQKDIEAERATKREIDHRNKMKFSALQYELMEELAAVKAAVITSQQSESRLRMHEAAVRARVLIEKVSHDHATAQTAKDFLQLCLVIADGNSHKEDVRDEMQYLREMTPPFFDFLRRGESVERDKIPMPEWMTDQ